TVPVIAPDAGAGRAVTGVVDRWREELAGRRLGSGAEVVADVTDQRALLEVADLVITGEGRFDHQSLGGKVAVALARAARDRGIPVLVLAGQVAVDGADSDLGALGLAGVHSVSEHAGSVRLAMTDAAAQLASLARSVACGWDERPASRGQRRE
ncbi:glycerate kinase, partial [Rhodococcus sp. NPDC004095]